MLAGARRCAVQRVSRFPHSQRFARGTILRDGRTTEVHFYVEKTIEYRLEEAKRMQRNAEFAREARALHDRAQPAMHWSLKGRIASWAPFRVRRQTRDRGAA